VNSWNNWNEFYSSDYTEDPSLRPKLVVTRSTSSPTPTPTPSPTSIPTNGLVAYYPFSGNANDGSGNGNHGTANGATLTTDRFGNTNSAYSFDGVDDYIDCGFSNIFQITDSITISAWVKHNTGSPGIWEDMVMKGNTAYGFQFYSTDGYFTFHLRIGGVWKNLSSGIKPVAGTWYHIVGTYDGISQRVYVNGVSRNEVALSGQIETNNYPLTMGFKVAGDNSYLNGAIDDVRIYNRALTESEVWALYVTP
jgi:hypothetical protein